MEHVLKIKPEFFYEVINGAKTFEVRMNDREYSVGDKLTLAEYDSELKKFTGNLTETLVITYVLGGGQYGIKKEYCVLCFRKEVE